MTQSGTLGTSSFKPSGLLLIAVAIAKTTAVAITSLKRLTPIKQKISSISWSILTFPDFYLLLQPINATQILFDLSEGNALCGTVSRFWAAVVMWTILPTTIEKARLATIA